MVKSQFDMAERKCIDQRNVTQSNGRATCPDRFYNAYLEKANCGNCPKVSPTGRLYLGPRMSAGEVTAQTIFMKNLLNDLGGRRSSRN